MVTRSLSRRRLLGSAAIGGAAAIALAACGEAKVVTVEKVVTKEVPVERVVIKEVPVETVVEKVVTRDVVVEKIVEAAPQRPPLMLEYSTDWSAGIRKKTHEFMRDEFQKQNPHVTVDILILSGEGSTAVGYAGLLTNLLVAGSGPDVMAELWWNPDVYNLDLGPHLQRAGLTPADFWWHDEYLVDKSGNIKGLPFGVYEGGMAANINLVEQFGVQIPEKDYGFDELREMAQKMRDPEAGIWGLERQTGGWNQGWADRFASEGAQWYDTATSTSTITQATVPGGDAVASFSDWWGLAWTDGVAPTTDEAQATLSSPSNATGTSNLFATGLIGMSGFSFNQGGRMKDMVEGRFDFHVFWPPQSPYTGRRGYHTEVNNVTVNAAAERRGHAEEAAALAMFWHGDEMTEFHAEFQPVLPARRDTWSNPKITEFASGMHIFPELTAEAEKIGQFRENWIRGTHAHPNWLEWWRVALAKMGDRALVGGEDPAAMLAELEEEGTEALQREI
jgi:hypothetical protein